MDNVNFMLRINEDGSITIPAFAVRGLGYRPGDTVDLAIPIHQPDCDTECCCDELFLSRSCSDTICTGYTAEGNMVNLPPRLFAKAGIPLGTRVNVMAGDNALVLVAGTEVCEDLACEVDCLLTELGIDAGPCLYLGADF